MLRGAPRGMRVYYEIVSIASGRAGYHGQGNISSYLKYHQKKDMFPHIRNRKGES